MRVETSDADLVLIALWSLVDPDEACDPSLGLMGVRAGRVELARACGAVRPLNHRHINNALRALGGAGAIDIAEEAKRGRGGAGLYELLMPPPTLLRYHQEDGETNQALTWPSLVFEVVRGIDGLVALAGGGAVTGEQLADEVVAGGPLALLYRAVRLAGWAGLA